MIDSSVTYVLHRVHKDGTEELIPESTTTDEVTCIEMGYRLCREEREVGFSLYRDETRRMKFCHDRLVLRLRPGSVEMIAAL